MHVVYLARLLQDLWTYSGILSIALAGVALKLDRVAESYFIETDPDFEPEVLQTMLRFSSEAGYEVMPEWECPPEERPGGRLRHWLAERSDAYDGTGVLQAV